MNRQDGQRFFSMPPLPSETAMEGWARQLVVWRADKLIATARR